MKWTISLEHQTQHSAHSGGSILTIPTLSPRPKGLETPMNRPSTGEREECISKVIPELTPFPKADSTPRSRWVGIVNPAAGSILGF